MDIQYDDVICYTAWSITKNQADSLWEAVKRDQLNPPKFHQLGDGNITIWDSASADGHNCFTWARNLEILKMNGSK